MKANYSHSAYMPQAVQCSVREFDEDHEYARFLHWADIFRVKMDVLESAGALDVMLSMRCLEALQDAQFSYSYVKVAAYNHMLDQRLELVA